MTGLVSWSLTAVLTAIAGLHAYWAIGGLWPADSEEQLVRTVIGTPGHRRMPPVWMTVIVALALACMAAWPLVLSSLADRLAGSWLTIAGSAVLTGLFILRGVAGYLPAWRRTHAAKPFDRFDRTLYSPLCLAIGAGFLVFTLMDGQN
jgi:hypothetical protein